MFSNSENVLNCCLISTWMCIFMMGILYRKVSMMIFMMETQFIKTYEHGTASKYIFPNIKWGGSRSP